MNEKEKDLIERIRGILAEMESMEMYPQILIEHPENCFTDGKNSINYLLDKLEGELKNGRRNKRSKQNTKKERNAESRVVLFEVYTWL